MTQTVLSVQSHVAFGHVGNSVAVFALQRLGLDVWPVPTVMLSSNKGYADACGFRVEASDLWAILRAVEQRGIFDQGCAILSGYLGGCDSAEALLGFLEQQRGSTYLLDPVMGDRDIGVFVEPELCGFFKERALERATIVTPNHFEAEILLDRPINSLEEAVQAGLDLCAAGPRMSVITSLVLDELRGTIGNLLVTERQAWLASTQKLEGRLNGTGDLFAALFLGRYLQFDDPVAALAKATGSTFDLAEATIGGCRAELMLVERQQDLVEPRCAPALRQVR